MSKAGHPTGAGRRASKMKSHFERAMTIFLDHPGSAKARRSLSRLIRCPTGRSGPLSDQGGLPRQGHRSVFAAEIGGGGFWSSKDEDDAASSRSCAVTIATISLPTPRTSLTSPRSMSVRNSSRGRTIRRSRSFRLAAERGRAGGEHERRLEGGRGHAGTLRASHPERSTAAVAEEQEGVRAGRF